MQGLPKRGQYRMNSIEIIRVHLAVVKKRFGVKKIRVFGSYTRADETDVSDQLKDPKFAERFSKAGEAWDVALQIASLRNEADMSQTELAKKMGTTQQQIAWSHPHMKGTP